MLRPYGPTVQTHLTLKPVLELNKLPVFEPCHQDWYEQPADISKRYGNALAPPHLQ